VAPASGGSTGTANGHGPAPALDNDSAPNG
jgi:hypothetical protein